jgi:hypothetical protein
MVVKARGEVISPLDLGYFALFLGLRVNQLVIKRMRTEGFQAMDT